MGKAAATGDAKDYFGTIAGVICEGPVDELVSIIVDGHEVWPIAKNWKPGESITEDDLRKYDGRTWIALDSHTASLFPHNNPPGAHWAEYSLVRGAEDYVDITIEKRKGSIIRFYWGTQTQTVDSDLTSAGNDFEEEHPNYKGICYAVLKKFWLGREKTSAPNLEIVARRKPLQTIVTGDAAGLREGQANAIAIAAELFTSENALGQASALLDATSAQDTADALDDRNTLTAVSLLIDSQDTFRGHFNRLREVSDCFARFNAANKIIEFGVYTHGIAPEDFITLITKDFAEPPSFKGEGWSAAKTRAVVKFTDRTRAFKESSDKMTDLRAYTIVGEHRTLDLDRTLITRRTQALAHAAETLKAIGGPQVTGDVSVRREIARVILPGTYVLVDIDLEPGLDGLYQFFRVTGRTIPKRGAIDFTLEAEEALHPIPWAGAATPLNDVDDPVPEIENLRIVETPAGLAGNRFTVLALAERPDVLVSGMHVYFDTDSGGDFLQLGGATVFAMRATLRSDLTDSSTTIEINVPDQVNDDRLTDDPGTIAANDDTLLAILIEKDGANIKEDDSGFTWMELCSISARSVGSGGDYDLTVLRGRLGTLARAFTDDDCEIWIIPRAGLLQYEHGDFAELIRNRAAGDTPDTGYFRLAPFTYVAERDLGDCANFDYRFPCCIQSGPQLTFTAPTSPGISVSGTYPQIVNVTGTASDADGNLVGLKVTLKKSGGSEVPLHDEDILAPVESVSFDVPIQIDDGGTYFIYVRAYDNFGLKSEATFTVTAAAGTAKCATPNFFVAGKLIPDGSTLLFGSGLIELRCATEGATIEWGWSPAGIAFVPGYTDYDPNDPSTWPTVPDPTIDHDPTAGTTFYTRLWARAYKTSWVTSDGVRLISS